MKIGSYITEVLLRGEKTQQLEKNPLLGMEVTYSVSHIYGRIGNFCANQVLAFNNTLFCAFVCISFVLWVDLAECQVPSKAALSSPGQE